MKTIVTVLFLISLFMIQSCGVSNFSGGKIKKRRVHSAHVNVIPESNKVEAQLSTAIQPIQAEKEIQKEEMTIAISETQTIEEPTSEVEQRFTSERKTNRVSKIISSKKSIVRQAKVITTQLPKLNPMTLKELGVEFRLLRLSVP